MRRWQLTEYVSYFRDKLPCSDRCHETMTTDGTCFLPEEYISMCRPLTWDGGNWQSMFHTWMIYDHALTFVIKRWQRMEQVSYMNDKLPCSDLCHKTMTTDGAWIVPKRYITMLWPLSWDDHNWQSMFHLLMIYYHGLTVIMRRWQLKEHFSFLSDITMLWSLSWDDDKWRRMIHILEIYCHALMERCHETMTTDWACFIHNDILLCSDRCHETMTSEGASFIHKGDIAMFWTLSWDDDKWRSIIYNLEIYYHDLTVAMRGWQLTEHASYLRDE